MQGLRRAMISSAFFLVRTFARVLGPGVLLAVLASGALDHVSGQGSGRSSTNKDRTGTIQARVADASDKELSGVTVTLRVKQCHCSDCQDAKKCTCCPDQRSGTTNANGVVSFTVPGGTYAFRAEVSGFGVVEGEATVTAGKTEKINVRARSSSRSKD